MLFTLFKLNRASELRWTSKVPKLWEQDLILHNATILLNKTTLCINERVDSINNLDKLMAFNATRPKLKKLISKGKLSKVKSIVILVEEDCSLSWYSIGFVRKYSLGKNKLMFMPIERLMR